MSGVDLTPVRTKPPRETPRGWRWALLKDVARLESGHTPSRREPHYWGGDIRWLSLKDIRGLDGAYIYDTEDHPTPAGIANSSARVLPGGTVAFCRTASVGKAVILGREMATSQDFVNWVCGPELDHEYLYRALLASGPEFAREKQGSTHKTIYMPTVERFQVLLPPLPEQRRIAAILDQADAIRRKRREAPGLLDEMLRSAFLELFGDPVTNPRGWPIERLGDACEFVGGGTPSRAVPEFFTGEICWATSKDMGVQELVDTQEHITEEAISSSATKLVPAGCLLVVVKSKVLAHTLPVAVARVPVCFGQDLKAVVPKPGWPAEYLAWHLRIGQTRLLERARGANTEGLTLEHLREYALLKPPQELRSRFVEKRSAIAAMKANAELAVAESERLLASLLHRAFAGKL